MKKLNRFVPSPALVIACIALFVAMGGSAYALATGSIDGREINELHASTGKDVKKDGLGGVTVKESRLGTVPSASGLQRSAVVGPLGQFVRGKDVASVGRTARGPLPGDLPQQRPGLRVRGLARRSQRQRPRPWARPARRASRPTPTPVQVRTVVEQRQRRPTGRST